MRNIFKSDNNNFFRKIFINKYVIAIFVFLIWMVFFDDNSFLMIRQLNREVKHYQKKYEYYKSEYEKNTLNYKKLINNKDEKEKFARENYFMKKSNEEIFILVVDSANVKKQDEQ